MIQEFLNTLHIKKLNDIDVNIEKIYENFEKNIDCVQYFLSYKRSNNSLECFNKHGIDILEIPKNGVRVFFNKVSCENDKYWEEVNIKYIPICNMLFCAIKIVYDNPNMLVKCYTLSNSYRRKLQKLKIIDNDIIYSDVSYFFSNR